MPRVVNADLLDGAKSVERAYEPPNAIRQKPPKDDEALKYVTALIERLPGMIAAATKAPIVHVEASKPPDVKVASPSVYLTTPEIKVPASTVNVPEGKAPVVNIEPPTVQLTINRPKKWKFTVHRDEFSRITTIDAETT